MKGSLKQYRTWLTTYLNLLRGRVALLALLLFGGSVLLHTQIDKRRCSQ
jgi:hypothetical protein